MIYCKFLGTVPLELTIFSNLKYGRILIYFKSFLQIKFIDVKYLLECINFKEKITKKFFKFWSLYRSLSHNKDEFETFLENFELNFDHMAEKNPISRFFLVILTED